MDLLKGIAGLDFRLSLPVILIGDSDQSPSITKLAASYQANPQSGQITYKSRGFDQHPNAGEAFVECQRRYDVGRVK